VRLLGLTAEGLTPAHLEQLTLFDRPREIDDMVKAAEPRTKYGGED
jgi:hypothetical protein